ncbi:beta-phosphoglucomutase family hydrolase [Nocardia puris]|uniref:HAD superfamily hydrolase (TIGR01509 family)/beta-phosphoglucomutase family hydrolase n=1 Tax=Nocardia puris TaxID=208602 RepID=A0A366E3N4_9NOCA|nr:beta-phosphoglucomutase family hydrolase [Nocardia puris]MBF6209714.1 beta-phosphoglucomutase family hydrolase [Nocardia puris]MBF6366286.1 beta-phosphoglucomutase family hydrolase [Nocardia puris]MBF6458375.1 beta-phosphoglucomutase family hydrolase [Nocardia puris]RBO96018.1 HAD superfamily hydrolase (TIGR01509 family)/beta-phosphoglucomutase family hydrolase [Nocardia puris]
MRLEHLPGPAGRTADGFGAVVFDMDGVVTDTAATHAAAWKALFDEALPRLAAAAPPFDIRADYRPYVDGRAREDGVRAFCAARGLPLPEGDPDDDPGALTVHGLAKRKQRLFAAELARTGVRVFPDAAALLESLRAAHVPTALVTASRNAAAVLDAAGLTTLFTVRVDGTDAEAMGLPGKPDPALFLEAARRLGVEPADTVVLEDAEAGVRAGEAGGFGLVAGVDRAGAGARLAAAGADVVVTDLADLALAPRHPGGPGTRWGGGAAGDVPGGWNLIYDDFVPAAETTREALCTTGNGYWASRGSATGGTAGAVHNPGTYLAGVYNRAIARIDGRVVEIEHLVNAPDWTHTTIRPDGGAPLTPDSPALVGHHRDLNLRAGVLTTVDRYRDDRDRATTVTTRRFHSVAEPHLAVMEVTVEADNWSGTVCFGVGVNGGVRNRNVAADRVLGGDHLAPGRHRALDRDTLLYETSTLRSGVALAFALRTRTESRVLARTARDDPLCPGTELEFEIRPGAAVSVERVVAVATSRDRAVATAALAAADRIARAPRAAAILAAHVSAWAGLWGRFGIRLGGDLRHRLALNLHVFHVLQATAAAGPDLDAGMPARGLHGEGYRGHIFWDELFVYPILTLRRPELTRAFLRYRARRLDRARDAARAEGLDGALFPWRSGSDGREECPTELLNTRTGRWMPDRSHRQRHIGLAVAYSVWQYYQSTADDRFLLEHGAELMIEVARLFAGLAVHDPSEDRFDITGVMGPDEYHDGYPDRSEPGLRNNTYTNVLTAWVLARAGEVARLLDGWDCAPLRERLRLRPEEPARWDHISRRLRVPFHRDGIVSQFEGYEDLAEFEWDAYRSRYGNIERLDLILHAEGDTTNRYKLSKQADVLMLFYLFSAEELRHVFERLGYALPPELIPRTVRYYLARTSHGSTLSRLAHAWVLARTDRAASWTLFTRALDADLADTQGGTTREGVHIGAMAGTADMVLRCYGGIETRHDMLRLHPVLPVELREAEFTIAYRGQLLGVRVTHTEVRLDLHPSSAEPIRVCVEDEERVLGAGQSWTVPLLPRNAFPENADRPE